MSRCVLSPAAEADLDEIWDFTADRWSIAQADRNVGELRLSCDLLATGQRKGRSIENLRAGYRKLSVGSHLIVYRMVGDTTDVVRILHQSMDIEARLEE